MALHDSLRELVAARGAAVTDDATELRGALDDFLGEEEASLGELNLLVDAVRLGALDRLLTMLRNGAAPDAAVTEAGAALARDRGSDDTRRARWAVAALAYALGRVDAGVVQRTVPVAGPARPPAPPAPAPPPAPSPSPPGPPTEAHPPPTDTVGSAEAVPTALGERSASVPSGPSGPPPGPAGPGRPPGRRTRRSPVLLVVSFAVVLGLVGGVGLALWLQRDTGGDGVENAGTAATPDDEGTEGQRKERRFPQGALPPSQVVVPYRDAARSTALWALDTRTGEVEQLTFGPDDTLPAISQDRTQLAYLESLGDSRFRLRVLDLPSADLPATGRDVFAGNGPCAHARRPGWSPDGTRLAVVCAGDGSSSLGIFVARETGAGADEAIAGTTFSGSPTWVDEERFVYNVNDENGDPLAFSVYDTTTGGTEPITVEGVTGTVSHQDWSPEAGRMLFLSHDDPADDFGELWIADADFSGARSLGATVAHPVWSPDGTAIAFTVLEDGVEVLATARFDGSRLGPVEIFPDPPPGEVGIPAWGSR